MANEERNRLRSLLKQFRSGMLVTRGTDGVMRARPMAIAKLDENDDVYFATSVESGKVDDVAHEGAAAVTFQASKAYVSLHGPVSIVKDRGKIDAAWSEEMRVWFPKGKDDPSLCLLQLSPTHAEFWDMEGAKGIKYVFEAAKAYMTGTKPATSAEQHGVVEARSR